MDHRDQIGGIKFTTSGVTYLTILQYPITCFQTFAGHPKSMAYRLDPARILVFFRDLMVKNSW
ncbi:hypothetical protein [Aquiflexum balticum]|uniref:hypothetical protein n=1 Tax=Aquiflexum balticum TaxID=280473 RepID=UPI0009FD08A4|nr:hypothetical protein [Aquiflexum balticum]